MIYEKEFTKYLEKEKNASYSTLNAYLSDVSGFCEYLAGQRSKSAEKASKADLAAYVMELGGSGRSSSTINRKMSSIRCFYDFLAGMGAVSENPTAGIKAPKVVRREMDFLSVEEVEKLLDAPCGEDSKSLRDKALLELMYATGMRAGEAAQANVSDVNLLIGFISCSGEGKTRIIPIGRPARAALQAYLDGARSQIMKNEHNTDALFVNFQGQRLSRQGIWKILKLYAEKAGIEGNISPQVLRNSFAAHMIQNGADLKSIQELLGLEDINAAKLYMYVSKNRIMDVYDRTHPRALQGQKQD